MRWVATAAAVEAAATGLILLVSPALFGWLIFGAELSEPGLALGRLTGIALLGFALTSWPAPPRDLSLARCLSTICSQPFIFFIWVSRQRLWVCCYGLPLRCTCSSLFCWLRRAWVPGEREI
jgi:hypothetical protein